ncbi:hypothetical protein A2U01_0035355 [Trifolium medium]|uniref:Uncharacterized protein n=1 Tax=Trifolium medium TaxID=97028 RepID=A0A392PSE0_9FABA|nr:hypothetical protein [Trifolium medium]
MDLILRAAQRNRRVAQDLEIEWKELMLAARGARRRAVKNCLEGVSVFCARRSFIRRVSRVECSSGAWRRCIWRVD